MKVSTTLDFETETIIIVLEEDKRKVILKIRKEDIIRAINQLSNPVAKLALKTLGWEIEVVEDEGSSGL